MQLWTKPAGKTRASAAARVTNARAAAPSYPYIHHCARRRALRRRRARHVEHTAEAEQRLRQTNGLLPLPTANMPRPRDCGIRVNAR